MGMIPFIASYIHRIYDIIWYNLASKSIVWNHRKAPSQLGCPTRRHRPHAVSSSSASSGAYWVHQKPIGMVHMVQSKQVWDIPSSAWILICYDSQVDPKPVAGSSSRQDMNHFGSSFAKVILFHVPWFQDCWVRKMSHVYPPSFSFQTFKHHQNGDFCREDPLLIDVQMGWPLD